MIINKLGLCPTRLANAYFANNEQVSLASFTAAFYNAHVEGNLINLTFKN